MESKIAQKIAGEITLSPDPGGTMKKWREIFNISQSEISKYLDISPSTISDYESNRRKSPGINIIKRFVDAILNIDKEKGGAKLLQLAEEERESEFFKSVEFRTNVNGKMFMDAIEGECVAAAEELENKKIYGYTILDSIKVITELPYNEFSKIYGASAERALIFTKVSTGRSPMVVVRVSQTKPSIVVLHGCEEVDKLAQKIAEKERIPLIITHMEQSMIEQKLKQFEV